MDHNSLDHDREAHENQNLNIETLCIHAGQPPYPSTGALAMPISLSTGFEYSHTDSFSDLERPLCSTVQSLEELIAACESTKYAIAFPSGLAAICSVFNLACPGMHIIVGIDVYIGARYPFSKLTNTMDNVSSDYIDFSNIENVRNAIKPNTKVIWLETFSNPLLNVPDIKLISEIAHQHNIILVVDNTLGTPYVIKPINHGADIVVHSATKFINGHCDVLQGIVCTSDLEIYRKTREYQSLMADSPNPFDCYLAIRGMKTLHLRMKKSAKNAMKCALFLKSHPKVDFVRYPGLPDHPNYEYVKREMRNAGAVITWRIKGGEEEMKNFYYSLKIIDVAYASLGGVKSIINDPWLSKAYQETCQLPNNILRFSVGCEHYEDLIHDLSQALDKV
ncbi:unnamed protein product [Blepharisma stoltei]|uniref:Cystathionine gamma-lyase n=1 Tax=Blepharisma stoltei TaxID=1481888 RepID=A0AAU9J4S0_9CILI|nr:unnamed protein product [Blepharisma stoltei]